MFFSFPLFSSSSFLFTTWRVGGYRLFDIVLIWVSFFFSLDILFYMRPIFEGRVCIWRTDGLWYIKLEGAFSFFFPLPSSDLN